MIVLAKLKSEKYSFESKVGDKFEFTADISVSSKGIFSITIPDELSSIVYSLIPNDDNSMSVRNSSRSKKHVLCGDNLDKCRRLLSKAGNDYVSCEEKSEYVILYSAVNEVSYVKSPDGEIFPNGSFDGACYNSGGKWHGTGYNKSIHYIGFAAVCRKKTTYIRPSGTKSKYDIEHVDGKYWELLNSFCGINEDIGKMQEIPYTEETAEFFYNTMMAMCHLADRLEMFFSDKTLLQRAIKENIPPLLTK